MVRGETGLWGQRRFGRATTSAGLTLEVSTDEELAGGDHFVGWVGGLECGLRVSWVEEEETSRAGS